MKLKLSDYSMAKRLIAMYFGSSFVVLASFALIVQYSVKHHFYEQDYQLAHNTFITLFSQPEILGSDKELSLNEHNTYIWLREKDGILDFTNSAVPLPDKLRNDASLEWSVEGKDYRAFQFKLDHPLYYAAIVGLNIDHHTSFSNRFNVVLFWTFMLTSAVSGIYAVFTVRKGLEPLQVLQQYLSKVSSKNLDIRIPSTGLPLELSELVEAQNKMLDRLQTGFNRLSEFSSDIAHELRTPLTNIMTQTQVVLASSRSVGEYQDVLGSNIEELERLNKTIRDTLYLAKSENQLLHSNKEALKLEELISSLMEFYDFIADEKGVSLTLEGCATQFGDKVMLQRAIGNIISNALRHCDRDSVVTIKILENENFNIVNIANHGETIPEQSLPFIFERFYRADKSRQHSQSIGAGLGLPIAKSIVQAHGGSISVVSSNQKTEFTLVFDKQGT
ncbi:heavy metal sensor histidine kinase [Vibrio sp. HN007]|uniref:heavy metal sensor histidine kinase n=1 Tax=Vibrio iocasae TaxID=3098914 RepID=UPI0035D4E279